VAGKAVEDTAKSGAKHTFDLVASEVGSFGKHVLYIGLANGDEGTTLLHSLSGEVTKRLLAAGVRVTDLERGFTPHITVAKTGQNKASSLEFTPDVLAHLRNNDEARTMVKIESLQLCRMRGRLPGCYYHIVKESSLPAQTPDTHRT